MIERRKFSRVVYQANITLQQDDQQWKGSLVDLSLHGLLINLADDEKIKENSEFNVRFTLNESDIDISAECKLINRTDNTLRLCISHIDIDSISHLKRLIELNVGNSDMLLRQLSELTTLT
ncbi:PilZ domain-containing protein [Aliivibrio sp. S3MY1]|uniref:PilZ domain-containing protein n=1 Tax=unclassified Aliivibrio TaxID=2645654 RepID=UPI0023795698|nr:MULTISPECIES: PilZ domain-containing protein [unclassified Aliivibrio]MDD9197265.1 PilZ domain-containing protein [Aliivibrio sp. S3MY1]MDD9200440.1 PilZ domain-containing protein [Aliivibrio sp. S2MY1]